MSHYQTTQPLSQKVILHQEPCPGCLIAAIENTSYLTLLYMPHRRNHHHHQHRHHPVNSPPFPTKRITCQEFPNTWLGPDHATRMSHNLKVALHSKHSPCLLIVASEDTTTWPDFIIHRTSIQTLESVLTTLDMLFEVTWCKSPGACGESVPMVGWWNGPRETHIHPTRSSDSISFLIRKPGRPNLSQVKIKIKARHPYDDECYSINYESHVITGSFLQSMLMRRRRNRRETWRCGGVRWVGFAYEVAG